MQKKESAKLLRISYPLPGHSFPSNILTNKRNTAVQAHSWFLLLSQEVTLLDCHINDSLMHLCTYTVLITNQKHQ